MNKKLTNILRTNVTLYFICLVLFALAAIPFDVRLAIGEGAAAVLLLIIARRRSRSVQQSMRQYMDRFTGGMDSARSSNMLFAPLPMMVFDMDTQAVVWCNDGFLALTEQKEGVFDAHLNAVVPTFSVRWLMEGKNECPEHVVWNHRIYRVYGGLTRPTPDTPATMATTYWMDVTDSEQLRQTLQMTRPVVAILMVDNYEDLMKACPESKRSAVLAQLEEKLDQWSAGADGLMLHYDRDRYLFVFEERSYSDYAQHSPAPLRRAGSRAGGGGRRRGGYPVHRRGPGRRQLRRPVQKRVPGPGDGSEPGRRPGGGEGPAELPVLRRPGQEHREAHQGEVPGHGQRPGRADGRRPAGVRHGPQLWTPWARRQACAASPASGGRSARSSSTPRTTPPTPSCASWWSSRSITGPSSPAARRF